MSNNLNFWKLFFKGLLFYTILVILWGAWVRISFSGDGCGETWPLCKGVVLPEATHKKTWIELSHRMSSGLFGLLVFGSSILGLRKFKTTHQLRFWLKWNIVFTISEALLGAKLVLFGLVGTNQSYARTVSMALHSMNSLMLVLGILITYQHIENENNNLQLVKRQNNPWNIKGLSLSKMTTSLFVGFLFIAMTGAWAALASTLFPSQSLLEGLQSELATDAHHIMRLRTIHPFLALLIGGGVALIGWISFKLTDIKEATLKKQSLRLSVLFASGVVFGILTLLFLYPIWMKMAHLLIAYTLWINLIIWLREVRYTRTSN